MASRLKALARSQFACVAVCAARPRVRNAGPRPGSCVKVAQLPAPARRAWQFVAIHRPLGTNGASSCKTWTRTTWHLHRLRTSRPHRRGGGCSSGVEQAQPRRLKRTLLDDSDDYDDHDTSGRTRSDAPAAGSATSKAMPAALTSKRARLAALDSDRDLLLTNGTGRLVWG